MSDAGFSLDTTSGTGTRILSGYNFREVAPEILSPLSWSLVGAGMEQGFRQLGRRLRGPVPREVPAFVGYIAFRPYHVLTTIEALIASLPWVSREDVWELILGGPPPPAAGNGSRSGHRVTERLLASGRQLGLAAANGKAIRASLAAVAEAEDAVVRVGRRGSAWAGAHAADRLVAAARQAWAAHVQTTAAMIGTAALLRRVLQLRFDESTAWELIDSAARRGPDEHVRTDETVRLQDHADWINSYELAARHEPFCRWSPRVEATSAATATTTSGSVERHRGWSTEVPSGTTVGAAVARLLPLLQTTVAEREVTKANALRALHAARVLFETGFCGLDLADAAFLGVDELRSLPPGEQRSLVARRRDELDDASGLEVATDLRQRPDGIRELTRRADGARPVAAGRAPVADGAPSGSDPEGAAAGSGGKGAQGVGLAPGSAGGRPFWADAGDGTDGSGNGDSGDGDGDADGEVLCGYRVDGNWVIALQPAAVVTELGSKLSHVAIVCRELGTPLVTGVRVPRDPRPARVTVDGWTGAVSW